MLLFQLVQNFNFAQRFSFLHVVRLYISHDICRSLDYDFLGPDHMYEFHVIATDNDPVAPQSGSVTVQVRVTSSL